MGLSYSGDSHSGANRRAGQDVGGRPFTPLLVRQFPARLHMSLILTGVFLSGIFTSKVLLELGLRSMLVRYPIAVVCSYLLFFGFVRLWLFFVCRQPVGHIRWNGPHLDPCDLSGMLRDRAVGAGRGSSGQGPDGYPLRLDGTREGSSRRIESILDRVDIDADDSGGTGS